MAFELTTSSLKGHRQSVHSMAFVPNGTEWISASFDAQCVWRAPGFHDLKEVEAQSTARRSNP
jgi:hypothetical protein